MIVIVIGLRRTNLSGLYRHRRGLGFTWSRLQGRKYNIRITKLAFHAKESPIRTRAKVLSLVSSRFNIPDDVYSPAVRIPPNPGLPHCPQLFVFYSCISSMHRPGSDDTIGERYMEGNIISELPSLFATQRRVPSGHELKS